MKRYSIRGGAAGLVLFFSAAVVHGQGFTGPGTGEQAVMICCTIPTAEVRGLPHDSWVTVTGTITHALPGGKHFMFRDASSREASSSKEAASSSGDITVEIGPKEWRGLSVSATDIIELSGEVKIQRGQVSIKAKAVAGHGETIAGRYAATVSEAQNRAHDSWVVLTGNIVNALPGGKEYTFRDVSGDITVEIGRKEWRGLSVGVSDRVEISGEVKAKKGQVSVKAHAIRKTGA